LSRRSAPPSLLPSTGSSATICSSQSGLRQRSTLTAGRTAAGEPFSSCGTRSLVRCVALLLLSEQRGLTRLSSPSSITQLLIEQKLALCRASPGRLGARRIHPDHSAFLWGSRPKTAPLLDFFPVPLTRLLSDLDLMPVTRSRRVSMRDQPSEARRSLTTSCACESLLDP
jgi:hypothetical protein